MIRSYLYLNTDLKFNRTDSRMPTEAYVLLYVIGKGWYDIDKKAEKYIEKHSLPPLTGGSTYVRPNTTTFTKICIINIHRKNSIQKYEDFMSKLIAEAV